jgi:hypothetical protein
MMSRTLIAFVLALTCVPTLIADEASAAGPTRGSKSFDVNFAGGTMRTFLDEVRSAAGGINLVVTVHEVDYIQLPPIQLDDVSAPAAFEAIEGEYRLPNQGVLAIKVDTVDASGAADRPMVRVSADWPDDAADVAKVWNVIDLFSDSLRPEDVLTAVETAVDLLVEHGKPAQVRFHPATGVLIARGTRRQVETIDAVLGELRGHLVLKEVFDGLEQWTSDAAK